MSKPAIVHPFLFAVYPVLFLFAHNIRELEASVVLIPMGIVFSCTAVSVLLLTVALRDAQKAAILVSIAWVLFFSYSTLYCVIDEFIFNLGTVPATPNRFLFILCGVFYSFLAYRVIKTRKNLGNLAKLFNVAACSLVLISVTTIGIHAISDWNINRGEKKRRHCP